MEMELKNLLLRIESRLDDLTNAFHQLRSENEILRKEILGVPSSQNSEGMDLMETRTLRQMVEQTEYCVQKINSNILKNESEIENWKRSKQQGRAKTLVREESGSESLEESADQFPVVEIRSKTFAEESEILSKAFKKMMKEKKVEDGESLQGTSVHTISDSIPISKYTSASCTMKLSNFLESALTDLQCYFSFGSRNTGPMRVAGNFTEVFSFHGARYGCDFLCSFVISEAMRLTIRCFSCTSGDIYFGIGFTPAEVLTNHELLHTLHEMPLKPGVWMINKQSTKFPLESFAINGNLLARGHMTNGPRSIVLVEILKIMEISWPPSVVKGKKCLTDGKSFELNPFPNKGDSISRSIRKHGRFSCNVEIANCLNVPLRNGNEWYSNDKNFWPLEIQSFHRETFLGSSDTNFKAMFSYEIVSTDLALVIALTVGPGTNSFAASFSQIPAQCDKYELKALMNPNQWKIHHDKKYSDASKTLEVISDQNIRAELLMTEEKKSNLKIRIYAV